MRAIPLEVPRLGLDRLAQDFLLVRPTGGLLWQVQLEWTSHFLLKGLNVLDMYR